MTRPPRARWKDEAARARWQVAQRALRARSARARRLCCWCDAQATHHLVNASRADPACASHAAEYQPCYYSTIPIKGTP